MALFRHTTIWLRGTAVCLSLWAGASLAASTKAPWVPTWYAPPAESAAPQAPIQQLTLRQIVRSTVGGEALRVRLSNEFGQAPLHIAHAHVAHRLDGARTDAGLPLRFAGLAKVSIPPGGSVLSDAVALPVAAESDLAISLYIDQGQASTAHMTNRSQTYFARGDQVAEPELSLAPGPQGTWNSWLFVSAVELNTREAEGAWVAFGDSITDGLNVEGDHGLSWPDRLHARLRRQGLHLSVVNAGITGNRLTRPTQWPPFGTRGLDRYERDVLSQPGARAVFILIGINDLGQGTLSSPQDASPADLLQAYGALISRAHARGLKVFLGTLLPFKGAGDGYYTDAKEALRQEVNAWIRSNTEADGVFDTDLALANPADPLALRPEYDSGDHLHPNARGAQAIADAIPSAWFSQATAGGAAKPH